MASKDRPFWKRALGIASRAPENVPHRPGRADPTSVDAASRVQGFPGVVAYGGYVESIDSAAELGGESRWRTYSELVANTPIVAASVRHYAALVGKATWRFVPANDTDEAKRVAEVVEEAIYRSRTAPSVFVRQLAFYRFFGYALAEWVAGSATASGVVPLANVLPRRQRTIQRWFLDRQGDFVHVEQRSPVTSKTVLLPRNKLIHVVDDALTDSPEGFPLLRAVVKAARDLRRYEQLEGFGFEGDLRGTPVGRAPLSEIDQMVQRNEITTADRVRLLDPMRTFLKHHIKRPDLSLLLDSAPYREDDDSATPAQTRMWDIELLKHGVSGQDSVANAIVRKQHEIARVLGTEGMLLGQARQGSFALSEDKSASFRQNVESALEDVARSLRRDLVRPLAYLNGYDDDALMPYPVADGVEKQDGPALAKAIRDLALAGAEVSRDDECVSETLELMGLAPFSEVERPEDRIAHQREIELARMGRQPSDTSRQTSEDPRENGPVEDMG